VRLVVQMRKPEGDFPPALSDVAVSYADAPQAPSKYSSSFARTRDTAVPATREAAVRRSRDNGGGRTGPSSPEDVKAGGYPPGLQQRSERRTTRSSHTSGKIMEYGRRVNGPQPSLLRSAGFAVPDT
jgi:hypothetical protein